MFIKMRLSYKYYVKQPGTPSQKARESLAFDTKASLIEYLNSIHEMVQKNDTIPNITHSISLTLSGCINQTIYKAFTTSSFDALREHIESLPFEHGPEYRNWAMELRKL